MNTSTLALSMKQTLEKRMDNAIKWLQLGKTSRSGISLPDEFLVF